MREYGDAPEVSVYGDPRFTFAYVPSHLHHMVRTACRPPFDLDTTSALSPPLAYQNPGQKPSDLMSVPDAEPAWLDGVAGVRIGEELAARCERPIRRQGRPAAADQARRG